MGARGSIEGFERRKGIRAKDEELSKYCELGGAQRSRATMNLLSRGKCENDRGMSCRFAHLGSLAVLEVSNPPKPSREPPAQGSTQTRRARKDTRPISRTARRAKRDTIYRIEESDDDLEDSDEGGVWERTEGSDWVRILVFIQSMNVDDHRRGKSVVT